MDTLQDSYTRWKASQNKQTLAEVLYNLNPAINAAIRSYAPALQGKIETRARIMVVDLLKGYNPATKVPLRSYVSQGLRPMFRIAHQRTNVIKVPEDRMLEVNKLYKTTTEFKSEYDRDPTLEELSDATGMSAKRIEKVQTKSRKTVSESGTADVESGLSTFKTQADPQQMWADYVYADLDPVNKKIFEYSTGYGGTPVLNKKDIAVKLKISAPAISQRIDKITSLLSNGAGL